MNSGREHDVNYFLGPVARQLALSGQPFCVPLGGGGGSHADISPLNMQLIGPRSTSGAGTNLKVGGTDPAQNAGKFFFCWGRAPLYFWL